MTESDDYVKGFKRRYEERKNSPNRCTMTLNLTPVEMDVLEKMAIEKDVSKTALLRQALRLYQLVDVRVSQGNTMIFVDKDGNNIELQML